MGRICFSFNANDLEKGGKYVMSVSSAMEDYLATLYSKDSVNSLNH